ncbi:hypothetical protein BIV57_07645 [Mangrovactinospora gilvigrisea]|uniref:Uncharacterized protein n=1 Tax=Mangrovactinospora gilvigrisea TaxID=1428644 RepID=A0A1J7C974_9ACTN|nr:hypothetical protein [Mangrovactinospora gilvigrisea]OIV38076.1 hypothetical protein BIV57_07645 [Mangrovactinospora gilvigrisea]
MAEPLLLSTHYIDPLADQAALDHQSAELALHLESVGDETDVIAHGALRGQGLDFAITRYQNPQFDRPGADIFGVLRLLRTPLGFHLAFSQEPTSALAMRQLALLRCPLERLAVEPGALLPDDPLSRRITTRTSSSGLEAKVMASWTALNPGPGSFCESWALLSHPDEDHVRLQIESWPHQGAVLLREGWFPETADAYAWLERRYACAPCRPLPPPPEDAALAALAPQLPIFDPTHPAITATTLTALAHPSADRQPPPPAPGPPDHRRHR